jgi:hypothetical protein
MQQLSICAKHKEIESRLSKVEQMSGEFPNMAALMEELSGFRRAAEASQTAAQAAHTVADAAHRIAGQLFDQVSRLAVEVNRIIEWRDDSKVQEIAELRRQLELQVKNEALLVQAKEHRRSLHEIAVDRRKLFHKVVTIIVAAVVSTAIGVIAGRLSSHWGIEVHAPSGEHK